MTEYGQAFYGSDEISIVLHRQIGRCRSHDNGKWLRSAFLKFNMPCALYKLPKNHWFYDSDEFKRAKKPIILMMNCRIKSMQAEIERRKAQADEITILARKVCADNNNPYHLQADFIEGRRDKTIDMRLAKAAIIAGMELQKGRET